MAKAAVVTTSGVRIEAETYSRVERHDRARLYQDGRCVGDVACGEAYALERGPVLGRDGAESEDAYADLERELFADAAAQHLTPA